MNLSKFKKALRAMRADWITDRNEEHVCSLHRGIAPDWLTFGVARGYLETLPEVERYIPVKLTESGFQWVASWKHGLCISGKKTRN